MSSNTKVRNSVIGGLTAWHLLRLFNKVRLAFGVLLALLGLTNSSRVFFPSAVLDAPILWLGVFYIISAIVLYRLITTRRLAVFTVGYLSNAIDIFLIVVLLGLGGLDSGFQSLLIIPSLAGALLLRQPHTYAPAAACTLLLLGLYVLEVLQSNLSSERFFSAGAFGISLFAIALSVQFVSRQLAVKTDEIEAAGVDLANLTAVNDLVIQNLDSGIVVCDQSDNVKMSNRLAFELLNHPENSRYSSLRLLNSDLAERLALWRLFPHEKVGPIEVDGRKIAPSFRHLSDERSACIIFLNDAEKQSLEAQKHKLASLGQLTASIAHEIRNPLSAITSAGQLLEEGGQLSDGDRRLAEIIRDHCLRVNNIVENVLQLSSRQSGVVSELVLGEWLTRFIGDYCQMSGIARELIKEDIKLKTETLSVNSGHLDQILRNLLDNAVKYGNGEKHGVVVVADYSPSKSHIWLDIIDSGPGVPDQLRTRIFEPFYTAGGGTGLGLYIANELASVNNASLSVLPTNKRGAHFRLSFDLS